MSRRKLTPVLLLLAPLSGIVLAVSQGACGSPPTAHVKRVELRSELIGGPRALGEVGDWLLENDKIRVIIQDTGFSRGFGVFGGALIDADLVRPGATTGDARGGEGMDNFGELFPSFFLEALEPSEVNNPNLVTCRDDSNCRDGERCVPPLDDPNGDPEGCTIDGETVPNKLPPIEILNDGSDGNPAVLAVRGYGNDFLAITQTINEALLNDPRDAPRLLFETRYSLEAGAQYLKIETNVQNVAFPPEPQEFTGSFAGIEVPTPFGDVALFGAGNKVFVPHEAGFDLRYRLEKEYAANAYELPAFPGLVAEYIASASADVSYGILPTAPDDPEGNYAYKNRDQFLDATPHSLHVPFIASAFTGLFQVNPQTLAANDNLPGGDDAFSFSRSFIIGSGDVASITEVVHEILGNETGAIVGKVLEDKSGASVANASIIIEDEAGVKVTQCQTDDGGRFAARALIPGAYKLRVVSHGRAATEAVDATVVANETTLSNLEVAAAGRLVVTVLEEGVGRIPAKVTVVGTVSQDKVGLDPKDSLSDLSLGEPVRFTDFVPDVATDPSTLQFIEDFAYTSTGTATLTVRPGTYRVFGSRGIEYSRDNVDDVVVTPGSTQAITLTIRREVETNGYIGADFHLHTRFSLDSDHPLDEAITGYAAEGVEFAVSTDHNAVVDYQPMIDTLGLAQHIKSAIGLELTTIDRGHFNGFPLQRQDGRLVPDPETFQDGGTPTYGRANPIATLGDALGGLGNEPATTSYTNATAARTRGSFQWAARDPSDIFSDLRNLGRIDRTCLAANLDNPGACTGEREEMIIQVNHPRDSILGYFDQYGVNPETLAVEGQEGIFAPNTQQRREFRPDRFSWEFDAIEVFNGKRYEYLHSYRVPDGATIDPTSCCPVNEGDILRDLQPLDCDAELRDCACTPDDVTAQVASGTCDREQNVSFPGVIEDWFLMLNSGVRVIGTANSDSHEPHKEEPGYPRTYVRVPSDRPVDVTSDDVVAGLKAGDALMTNGPIVQVQVGPEGERVGMGGMTSTTDGEVDVVVTASCASWMSMSELRVYVSGTLARTVDVTGADGGGTNSINYRVTVPVPADGFIVVEVTGDSNMFPTVFPNEIKPLQFTDVLGAIGGALGPAVVEGALGPELTFATTPFALTNPVWIDVDGDGVITPARELPAVERTVAVPTVEAIAPGIDAPQAEDHPAVAAAEAKAAERTRLRDYFRHASRRKQSLLRRVPAYLWPSQDPADIRNVYFQFLRHNH